MPGLSSDLHKLCHTILLKCGEFDDHPSLQAIFVRAELITYRDRLPQANDRQERVSQTVLFLLDRHLSDGRPVFPIFLEALRDQYDPQDAHYHDLDRLRTAVEHELSEIEYIDIPFVIVAMTHNEANDLIQETVFDNPAVAEDERTRFREFKEALREHGIDIAALLPNYRESQGNWRPHIHQQNTVHEIISDIIDFANQRRAEIPGMPPVRPQFFSSGFFTEDEDTRLDTWDQLGRLGCVIIIDSISVFHPMLRRILLRSEMGSNERSAMLVLSPVNSSTMPVNQLIEREIGSQMQRAFARFDRHLDKLCEFGVGDLRALQRWLFSVLPEAADIVQHHKPIPSNRSIIRERMGEPLGMERVIFGQRGGQ